jgi:hypothetical protein
VSLPLLRSAPTWTNARSSAHLTGTNCQDQGAMWGAATGEGGRAPQRQAQRRRRTWKTAALLVAERLPVGQGAMFGSVEGGRREPFGEECHTKEGPEARPGKSSGWAAAQGRGWRRRELIEAERLMDKEKSLTRKYIQRTPTQGTWSTPPSLKLYSSHLHQ